MPPGTIWTEESVHFKEVSSFQGYIHLGKEKVSPFLSGVLYEGLHCSTACACVCVCVLKLSIHQIMEASGNRVKKINPHSGGGGGGGKSGGKKDILGPIGIVIILL